MTLLRQWIPALPVKSLAIGQPVDTMSHKDWLPVGYTLHIDRKTGKAGIH